jgi:PAS domain S-box-containing protein
MHDDTDRYRFLFDSIQDIAYFIRLDGSIIEINEAGIQAYGYSMEELKSMNIADLRTEAEREKLPELLETCYEYGCIFETVHQRKDGATFPVEINSRGIMLHGEKALIGVIRDITERKRTEDALFISEKFLNNVFNGIQDGVSVIDKDMSVVCYNPTIEKWHGKDLAGKKCYRIFHGRDEPCERCPSIRAMREKTVQREIVHDLIGWKEIYASPLVDDNGTVTGTIEQVRDITVRKQAEDALRRDQFILAKSQEMAHVGNWAWDIRTGEITGSAEYYRIFEFKPDEARLTMEGVLSYVHPDDRQALSDFTESRAVDGARGSIDYCISKPDGTISYINTIVDKAVRDKAGKVKRLYGINQDITERKRAEKALNEAKAQAELYLDLMGHDINNMHQIALGYLELAENMPQDVEQKELLEKPIEVLQRSARLIQNVRKLQKLSEGVFRTEKVDVAEMLADVQREFGAVPNKPVSLDLNGHGHCYVMAVELLHDVFSNLVSNAIKHTGSRADISIDLDRMEEDGKPYYRVSVEDDGPGVSDDFKGIIFNRALRGTSGAKGMGLGLYLVKSLVTSYNGRVWVEDRVPGDHSKGAKFVVMLPAVNE